MKKKILGIVILGVVIVLLLASIFYRNIFEGVNKCYAEGNDRLLSSINYIHTTHFDKKQACQIEKDNVDKLDSCIATVAKTSFFPRILFFSLDTAGQLRQKQQEHCR